MIGRKTFVSLILISIWVGFWGIPSLFAQDASEIMRWGEPQNMSRSPDAASGEPFVLGDPTGQAHLFFTEKTSDSPSNLPDTIMYSNWDGKSWSEPVDIFYAPLDYTIHSLGLQAILDDKGYIHLIWMAEPNFPNFTLFYSSAHASEAGNAGSWSTPVPLAEDLSGTNFGIAIAKGSNGHFHVLYARVQQGNFPPENRAVTYLRSEDGGKSWTEPLDLYTIPELNRGASNTRLLVDGADKVFATWSEWDESGNGQRVYFIRSMDGGVTWDKPVLLAKRVGVEYERDLPNLVKLGDKIGAVWEGGFRAYRQAQYSDDNGETWTEPVEIFPGLIGDNGYAMFVEDSLGRVHLFHAQRIREGNPRGHYGAEGSALWHSMWDGNSLWQRPYVITDLNATIVTADIFAGNQIVITWVTNDDDEVRTIVGEVMDAPSTLQPPWPDPSEENVAAEAPEIEPISEEIVEPPERVNELSFPEFGPVSEGQLVSPGNTIMLGLIPATLFILIVGLLFWRLKLR